MPTLKRPPYHPRPIGKTKVPRRQKRNIGLSGAASIGDVAASTAALDYKINGGAAILGVQSDWQRQPIRVDGTGVTVYGNWHTNTWSIATLTMATFEALRGQQGETLTSLESNDQITRNTRRIYKRAILESVVNGNQLGLIMNGASLVFRVDITS